MESSTHFVLRGKSFGHKSASKTYRNSVSHEKWQQSKNGSSCTKFPFCLEISLREREELLQLEVTYNDHLIQLPNHLWADQKLNLVINGIIQVFLKD